MWSNYISLKDNCIWYLSAVALVPVIALVSGVIHQHFPSSYLNKAHFTTEQVGNCRMMRQVAKIVTSNWQSEGVGAKVRRTIGSRQLANLDPFLLLDEFVTKPPAGFPDHPHRGFETVTYMLKGAMKHEDFKGHKGIIGEGDLQWMTAGRGILHSEMPATDGENHGMQLWVNLRKEHKMIEPAYQELLHKQIPTTETDGVFVKVIAGESMGIKSPVMTRTPAYYLDFTVQPGAKHSQEIPDEWTAFAYILSGDMHFGEESNQKKVEAHQIAIFSKGKVVHFDNKGSSPCHFILVAGEPTGEPVAQHGPFVMNTWEEIDQTISDYTNNRNGFENANSWKSEGKNK